MEVVEQQTQWRREGADAEESEEEEVEELTIRRRRSQRQENGAVAVAVAVDSSDDSDDSSTEAKELLNGDEKKCLDKGSVLANEPSVPQNGDLQVSASEKHPANGVALESKVNHHGQQTLKDVTTTDIELLPTEQSIEDPQITESSRDKKEGDTEVLKEGDEESADLDVERVINEQNTHDLYCPNCHSCITKRVILRKRKRNIKISDEEGKRNRLEIDVASQSYATSEHTIDDQRQNTVVNNLDGSQTPIADESNRDTEPEVFRCLSCFSFFIPQGNGFRLFSVFGDKGEKENLQTHQQTSLVKKNWLSSLFASREEEILADRDMEANVIAASQQEINSSPSLLVVSSSKKSPLVAPKLVGNGGEKPGQVQQEETVAGPATSHSEVLHPGKGSSHCEDSEVKALFGPQQDGLKIIVQSDAESLTFAKSQPDQKVNVVLGKKSTDDKNWLFPNQLPVQAQSENNEKVNPLSAYFLPEDGQNNGVKLPIQSIVEDKNVEVKISDASYSNGFPHSTISTKVENHVEKVFRNDSDSLSPSLTSLLLTERQENITKILKGVPGRNTGGDTIIVVTNDAVETASFQQAQNIIATAGIGSSTFTESAATRGFRGLEVIKSIVYGGLMESITSLAVVSSAVGSNAATLNIVALGLANLIGGLFIICHNLWDLKNDDHGVISDQVTHDRSNQTTRELHKYHDLLGRRENFLLHATIAILSYSIFGSLPPVIYGFSYRESNDRYFKLIAVAVASLLSIIMLAVGKAYVQRPPKSYIKTISYYIVMGFMVSGVTFAAGGLIKKLVEQLGWLSPGYDLSLSVVTDSSSQLGWSSY